MIWIKYFVVDPEKMQITQQLKYPSANKPQTAFEITKVVIDFQIK
jgi:hypothetical protein